MTHFIFWSFPSSRQWPRINISKGQKGIYYKETTETLSKGNRRRLHADYWRPLVGIFTDEIITGNFYNLKDKRLRGEGGVGRSLVEPVRSRLWIPSSGLSQKRFHALLVNFAIISTVNLASKWASQGWWLKKSTHNRYFSYLNKEIFNPAEREVFKQSVNKSLPGVVQLLGGNNFAALFQIVIQF